MLEDVRFSGIICIFYLYKKGEKKWKTEHARGMDAGPFRNEQPHLLINIIYTRVCIHVHIQYICIYMYIMKLVNRGRGWTHGRNTRNGMGHWKLCQREISQRKKERAKERRTKNMYDIHGDISLGTLSVRTESDPRRRDTRQSQNIWDELISFTLPTP